MDESEFITRIDCDFPYDAPIQWRKLSAMAPRISANSAFMVLHEICRVPRSEKMNRARAECSLSHVRRRFRHPALRVILPAIESYLSGEKLRPAKAAALMRRLAKHIGQYNALAICYLSAYDPDGKLDSLYEQIISHWSAHLEAIDEA
jgi:hypothetical protein